MPACSNDVEAGQELEEAVVRARARLAKSLPVMVQTGGGL